MKPILKSVKFRLTLWYAFVLTVFLSVFSYWMYEQLAKSLYEGADKTLLSEASTIRESLEIYLDKNLPSGPSANLIESVRQWEKSGKQISRSHLMIRLLSLDHNLVVSNLKIWEREIIFPDFERDAIFMENGESFQTIHFKEKPIRLYYALVQWKERSLFVIEMGISMSEERNALQRLAFIILLSIPGAVAVACVAGWFLAKRSFSPVDSMIREARQISAAYLKKRLPRTQTLDELDRLAETLNEMMDRIESSTRSIQEFSSDVSHELKTPLAIIRGEIDLALKKTRSPESLQATLRIIHGEVNELIRLVDDLLLLVRSDAKQLRFEKENVALKPLLEGLCQRFQDRLREKKINLECQLEKDAKILGDPVYLKRLFANLLDNAIKFSSEDGKVSLKLLPDHHTVSIEIRDNGMGIEPEFQSKIFSRFFRTDQARSHDGSGLGLNIAKAICDAHGGTLRIQSRPKEGTAAIVQFPL